MSESWRIKKYYDKRVLIDTVRVLDPQFPSTLICLDGAELEMLRNLTQYLHRRSTFAQGYETGYYLAPDNDDWDIIESLVANLEEKLMGCDEITTLLESMLAQLECVCVQTTSAIENALTTPKYTPATENIIDEYTLSDGLQTEDGYGDDTTAAIDRCAVAQLTFWQAWQFTTEILHPVAENTIDILLPAAMVALAASCGTAILAIPVGLLLALLWQLIEIDVHSSIQAVTNAMWAYKDELICAVWDGLGLDYRTAEQRATEVINDMEGLTALDKIALRMLYAPWGIGLAEKAWDNQTSWALANVSAGACDDCAWSSYQVWNFPPCPSEWAGTFICSSAGHPGININLTALSDEFTVQSISTDVDVELDVAWYSVHPSGWTVGYIFLQYQDVSLVWHDIGAITLSNNAAVGNLNTRDDTMDGVTIPRNVLRARIGGQGGQGQEHPFPVEVVTLSLRIFAE